MRLDAVAFALRLLLRLRRFLKGVQQCEPWNPSEVVHIAGHQRQAMHQRSASNEGISE